MIEFIKNKSTYKHLKFQFSKKFSRIRSTTNQTVPVFRVSASLKKEGAKPSCLPEPTISLAAITVIPRVRFIYEPRTGKRHALLTSRQGGSFGETASPRWHQRTLPLPRGIRSRSETKREKKRERGSEIGAKSGRDRTERTKVGKKRPYISHGISPASSNTPYLRIDTQFPASLAPIEGSLRLIAAAPFDFK